VRIFSATIATETNTFVSLPTSLKAYQDSLFLRPGEHPKDGPLGCTNPLFVARRRAKDEGFALIEGSCFGATPGGTTNKADYEFMRNEILDQVRAALPLDGVLLGLHGAMIAHGYDDTEGDITSRVREIVGNDCVIGVELDLHCHLTVKRLQNTDIMILYKEFPHTDVVDRAEELLTFVLRTIRKEIRPVTSVYDCRQIGIYPTTLPLMRKFVDRVAALEGKGGVLSISIGHCYPYADVAELSARILVITDGDKKLADELATELGQEFIAMRGKTEPDYLTPAQGVDVALAQKGAGPIVMAEPSDNAGAGSPSDNTTIIRLLIERGASNTAAAPIWDPIAVGLCFDAGMGAVFPLRFGGKTGPTSGQPIDAEAKVIGLKRNCTQRFGPSQQFLGDCAGIEIGGVQVVLISHRNQAIGLEIFENVGIDPRAKGIILVKSTNHFMAAFGPIASKVIYIESDGPILQNYKKIPYQKVQRPIWPLDEVTHPALVF